MGDTTADSREGSQFGQYRLRRLVGRGAMGDVYEAEDTVRERVVALKLMSPTLSSDPVFRTRMQREARTAGRLHEPHVVPIHDYGEIDGQLYVDMRLIDGKDLAAILKRYGPLTPPRAVAVVRQIGSALDAAHAAGVTHRDVKPENILVSGDDFAYLVDFGIASATSDEKLTQLGSTVGTLYYMAPERFANTEVTYRADIYALACVLYECLTGSPPYRGDQLSVMGAHLSQAIPRPSAARPGIPAAFDQVIARGMAMIRPTDTPPAGTCPRPPTRRWPPRPGPGHRHLAAQPGSPTAGRGRRPAGRGFRAPDAYAVDSRCTARRVVPADSARVAGPDGCTAAHAVDRRHRMGHRVSRDRRGTTVGSTAGPALWWRRRALVVGGRCGGGRSSRRGRTGHRRCQAVAVVGTAAGAHAAAGGRRG